MKILITDMSGATVNEADHDVIPRAGDFISSPVLPKGVSFSVQQVTWQLGLDGKFDSVEITVDKQAQ